MAVSWHPTLPLLAVGLDSGDLFSLLLNDKALKDTRFASPQKNPIQHLKWASENQLLSLDSVKLNFSAKLTISDVKTFFRLVFCLCGTIQKMGTFSF